MQGPWNVSIRKPMLAGAFGQDAGRAWWICPVNAWTRAQTQDRPAQPRPARIQPLASLHWGCVMLALALGFAGVELIGADHITPGTIALLLGATGLGNVAYYLLDRRSR